ncbi:uncharacterized protein LOC129751384 [Uranotaenia lowii]|uniref:uncharacterized protein LOC129751384 n=1 Tax=Uranotaenia lowii TaxID=190385 RepID=UPI00247AF041|nr:uncharacterized protein LOC129751384 [Uranotaenia lowii]
MLKLTLVIGLLVVLGSVAGQEKNTTEAIVSSSEVSSESVEATTETGPVQNVVQSAERTLRILQELRKEFLRRRNERQQRIAAVRESLNFENLSDRKREFELNRAEMERTPKEQETERQQEMEARRAGRVPAREQERITQIRLDRLQQAGIQDESQNEVDGLIPAVSEIIRSIVLIEEANGNMRLVDLSAPEGREMVSRIAQRVQAEGDSEDQQQQRDLLNKLRLRLGQL